VRKAFNAANGAQREESEDEDSPTCEVYENVPSMSIHIGAESDIADFETDRPFEGGTRSEITDFSGITFTQSPISGVFPRHSRFGFVRTPSRTTRNSSHLGFINPDGQFSRTLRDRGKFLWLLIKLNFRMLISLTLTLFVAIVVLPLPKFYIPFLMANMRYR
jgi:hypothetical protein